MHSMKHMLLKGPLPSHEPQIQFLLTFVAVCYCVLLCVAVCCSVLQREALRCSVLQCVAVRCNVLQCVAASHDPPIEILTM